MSSAWGGATGGLVCSLLVISMKWLGYSDLPMSEYVKLWPKIFFFGTTGGALGGWLACRFANCFNRVKASKRRRFYEAMIFATGFTVLLVVQQISVRDALRRPGSLEIVDHAGNVEIVGGLFGEPNFKTLAAGLFGGGSFLVLVRGLRNRKRFKQRTGLRVAFRAIIVGGALWSLMYLLFAVLTEFGMLVPNWRYPQDRMLSTVFIIDFPKPEQFVFFVIGGFIYVYSIMKLTASGDTKKEKAKLSKADEEFLGRVEAIIKESMGDMDFGPVQLAEKTGYDIRSLNRKVKQACGHNTTLLIRCMRLQWAAHLLEENAGNVTEICYQAGFRSLSYFERSFKARFGQTPKDYRKRRRMSE